ncbi:MAG: DUF4919 domain-containing protein [Alistipes sp.]|nr:DUF4919 domain-containing protein [Alistipes sp.]MBR3702875.1 DUF4919 domain-containing protein [Alistipes sp.]
MKRFFQILTVALLLPLISLAKIPDEDDILRKIIDRASPYYYPTLLERYRNLEQLNEDEYHYLYYGYAYNENYKPLAGCKALDDLILLMATIDTERPDKEEITEIISVCQDALMFDPFNPTVLNMMIFAYGNCGDREKEQAYYRHMNGILETIKSSGDGRGEKYPMHIIMFSHATDLVASLGVEHRKAEIISRKVEYIPLTEPRKVPDGKIKGFYFDYSRIYRNKPEDVTFKKKRTWQFNNLGVREYK